MADLRKAAVSDPDPIQRSNCSVIGLNGAIFTDIMSLTDVTFWDNLYGTEGELVIQAFRNFSYDEYHHYLVRMNNGDWVATGAAVSPLVSRYGSFGNVEEMIDTCFACLRRSIDEPDQATEHSTWMVLGLAMWAQILYTSGLEYGRDKLTDLFASSSLTWRTTDATVEGCLTPWVRKAGDRTMNAHTTAAESTTWMQKAGYVLMSKNPGVTTEEVLSALPPVEELIPAVMTIEKVSIFHGLCGVTVNVFIYLSAVCEKIGAHAQALVYADAALSTDLTRAGTTLPISRVLASGFRGRALAALGRSAEAGAVLDAAAQEAHRIGVWFYEAKALLDLKQLVLDPTGHAEHGSKRLVRRPEFTCRFMDICSFLSFISN